MTAAHEAPTELTGHLDLVWRPNATGSWPTVVVSAPDRTSMHVVDIDRYRDAARPDDIVTVGGVRYLLGPLHPHRSFHRYLFRLTTP